ncbi:MAK10-like protein [Tanacetum coccineum]
MLSKHVLRRRTFPRQASCKQGWGLERNLPVLKFLAYALIYNTILDKYVESLELGNNGSAFVQSKVSTKMEDPELFTLPCRLGDSKPFYSLADLGSCVNIIPLYPFKKLNIILLEETDHVFGLADGTKSYPVGIVKDVEVHIGKLKLLNDFYVIDMKKDPETPLLVGRGFLATANAVIDCRMAKIAVGEGITRESYKPRPSSDGVGAQIPYYARKDFLDCHFPGEWEIARDVEINPFKDVLVFRRMVEFLRAIPINLKSNMLYLTRRSLEVLRKFHWMILGGGFNHSDVAVTSMVERSKLDEDPQGTLVDPTHYQNHAVCQDSRPNTLRSAQFLREKHVSWPSKKLKCTAISTTEIPLCCDSKSAIALSCNTVQHSRTKHIVVRYHFIKEKVENEVVEIYFIKTAYQLADIFTKALARESFKLLINRLGMQRIMPEELKHLAESEEELFSLLLHVSLYYI